MWLLALFFPFCHAISLSSGTQVHLQMEGNANTFSCLSSTVVQVQGREELRHWEVKCRSQVAWVVAAKEFYRTAKAGKQGSYIHEAIWEMIKVLPFPDAHPMIPKRVTEYLDQIRPDYPDHIRAVRGYLKRANENYKSWDKFHLALKASFEKAVIQFSKHNEKADRGLWLWLTDESDTPYQKSQYWIMALCFASKPELIPLIKGVIIGTESIQQLPDNIELMFFDDISYSGTQLSKDVQLVLPKTPKNSHISLIVPFMSTNAGNAMRENINTKPLDALESSLDIYSASIQTDFREPAAVVFGGITDAMKLKLQEMGFVGGQFAIYTDHKIADNLSVFSQILNGWTPPKQKYLVDKAVKRILLYENCEGIPNGVSCPTEPYKLTLQQTVKFDID